MSSPSELSLDYKNNSLSMIQNQRPFAEQTEQMQRLQEFLSRLEEERLKIEAFKRELPLCMQLLNNAMEAYRHQLHTYQTSHGLRPLLEEFIPLKNMSIEESEKPAPMEKANWMVSAQLWSSPTAADATERSVPQLKESAENCFALISKPRCGGAFHPFSKDKNKDSTVPPPSSPPPPPPSFSPSTGALLPELALASVDGGMEEQIESGVVRGGRSCKVGGGDQPQSGKAGGGNCDVAGEAVPSTQRKARRCWSPDLHRRFVNALQILGGSQVATPKQIRELMKVDGLTNDEVKSHLQKYRLHTRRPMPAAAGAAAGPQLVVLGGIWVP
ncbi:hypothetical protein HPP92_019520 [Vanilla planifolia]|uniref:HTH myb-type domain-containing protein n=1 Tax=Vanilla planifolia TaxID=51239 RepID=A0A835UMZ5_VANPL|nr:hypothetical protein HPP92_019520 [Vanilla planifolia]